MNTGPTVETVNEVRPLNVVESNLAESIRIALVVDPALNIGMVANRAAVLATGLCAKHPEIIGPDLITADGITLPGFTKVPIAVLAAKDHGLLGLAEQAWERGLSTLVYLARAQGMRCYESYKESIAKSTREHLDVDTVLICGAKKAVNSLVGALPLLR